MGSLFRKPSKAGTRLQAQQIAAEEKRLASEEAERKKREKAEAASRTGRAGVGGRQSLLTGLETGVTGRDTLG